MEAERNALGQMNDCFGLASEVRRVEHEEVARIAVGVVNEGENPPVVLGRIRP